MKRILVAAFFFAMLAPFGGAQAVLPDEMLSDPALEARAREISKDLRCLVCQNQSIDDSNAELARDLRILVRQRIKAGDSNEEAREYIVARYGDYVLLDPPVKGITYALWFGPFAILLLAGGALIFAARRRSGEKVAQGLSEEEQARLSEILERDSG